MRKRRGKGWARRKSNGGGSRDASVARSSVWSAGCPNFAARRRPARTGSRRLPTPGCLSWRGISCGYRKCLTQVNYAAGPTKSCQNGRGSLSLGDICASMVMQRKSPDETGQPAALEPRAMDHGKALLRNWDTTLPAVVGIKLIRGYFNVNRHWPTLIRT